MSRFLVYGAFMGDNTYKACASNYGAIGFYNKKYVISLTAPSVAKKGNVIVSGNIRSVYDNNKPVKVNDIKIKYFDDAGNTSELSVNSNEKGVFTATLSLTRECIYSVFAIYEKDSMSINSGAVLINTSTVKTSMTLSSSVNNVYADDSFLITATLLDSGSNPLVNKTIEFYKDNDTTPFQTKTTNREGKAIISTAIGTIGTRQYQAVFKGEDVYEGCSTAKGKCNVNSRKHDMKITLNQTILYPNWYLSGYLRNEKNKGINNTTVSLTVNGTEYQIKTDKSGHFKTKNSFNLSSTATIKLKAWGTSKYNGFEKTIKLPVQSGVTLHNSTLTAVNWKTGKIGTTGKRYREWTQLGNILKEDEKVAVCGTSCANYDCIGTKSGTWNRPSPLRLSNFKMPVPNNSIITKLNVWMKIKSVWCENIATSIGAPKMYYTNGATLTSKINNGKNTVIPNSYSNVEASWNNISLKGSTFNDKTFYIYIDFPQNNASRKARLYLDQIKVNVEYQPKQTGI